MALFIFEKINYKQIFLFGLVVRMNVLDMAGILNPDIANEPFVEKYIKE